MLPCFCFITNKTNYRIPIKPAVRRLRARPCDKAPG
jgi:hypothetical protein